MNAATLKRNIELWAAAVAPLLASRRIIFSMDACPVHLVPSVLRSVSDGGMYLLLIAAKMTKWTRVQAWRRCNGHELRRPWRVYTEVPIWRTSTGLCWAGTSSAYSMVLPVSERRLSQGIV